MTVRLSTLHPGWLALLALPMLGLALLLVRPELDVAWQHQPSHFWLVLLTAMVNASLAYLTNLAAGRHRDARVVLVSLAFLAGAGFLGLHALATPGVLLSQPNVGFVVATPVGLVIASAFAAASAGRLGGPRAATVLRLRVPLLAGLLVVMAAWAMASLAGLPPLDGPPPAGESPGLLTALAVAGVVLDSWAAWRYLRLFRERGGIVPLAVGVSLILLAQALVAITLSRNWHLSWWEWHVLMLAAFVLIALGARQEYAHSGSLSAAFGGLYLEATLSRIDRWHGRALAAVATATERGVAPAQVLSQLRREGATSDELALLERAAGELRRLDETFRPYLPTVVVERIRSEPEVGRLGGQEREVTVLFADLSAFTAFSERHPPVEVIAMLNEYWAAIVPVIDVAAGVIEQFAGDAVMAIFNAAGDQPDHAARAVDAALAIIDAGRPIGAEHPGWPVFRVGVSTGPAVVGNVGVAGRRSFAAIGDTTNVAARLMAAAMPGQVVATASTWAVAGHGRRGSPLGPIAVRGKQEPVEAWLVGEPGSPPAG